MMTSAILHSPFKEGQLSFYIFVEMHSTAAQNNTHAFVLGATIQQGLFYVSMETYQNMSNNTLNY